MWVIWDVIALHKLTQKQVNQLYSISKLPLYHFYGIIYNSIYLTWQYILLNPTLNSLPSILVVGFNLRATKLSNIFKIQDWFFHLLKDAMVLQIKRKDSESSCYQTSLNSVPHMWQEDYLSQPQSSLGTQRTECYPSLI